MDKKKKSSNFFAAHENTNLGPQLNEIIFEIIHAMCSEGCSEMSVCFPYAAARNANYLILILY